MSAPPDQDMRTAPELGSSGRRAETTIRVNRATLL